MEFGHLSPGELNKLRFQLPPDPLENAAVLASGKSKKQKVWVGCAKWGRDEWVGKIYPKGTPAKKYLDEYGKHFNSIELNATNYQFVDESQIETWADKIKRDEFLFCPKAHRAISSMAPTDNKSSFTETFLNSILHFKEFLGPVFMTINGKYSLENQHYFFDYLMLFREAHPIFIEQRDPDFYSDPALLQNYFDILTSAGVGTVITDTAGRPDVCHMRLTVPKAFIRFVGNSLHPSDFPRVDHWVQRIKKWLESGIEEVYFFMHMHDEGLSPELARYTVAELNKHCGLSLPPVEFVAPVPGLFG